MKYRIKSNGIDYIVEEYIESSFLGFKGGKWKPIICNLVANSSYMITKKFKTITDARNFIKSMQKARDYEVVEVF